MVAQKATAIRRKLATVEAEYAALRAHQEVVENFLTDPPATDWGRVVAKASFLLILFAQTPEAEDLGRAKLIADVFADFKRLLAEPKRPPVAGARGGIHVPHSEADCDGKRSARGNRDAKKPKREKLKVAATGQASFGLTPLKSTLAKDGRGKKE
jgi:hypothetical protein